MELNKLQQRFFLFKDSSTSFAFLCRMGGGIQFKQSFTAYFLLFIMSLSIGSLSAQKDQNGILAGANDAFTRYEYANAAKLYEKIVDRNNKNLFAVSRLAFCYKSMNRFDEAEKYYKIAISLPGVVASDWLFFGDILKNNGKYDAAKEIYKEYQNRSDSIDITNKINGCDSALLWIKHPDGYSIENVGYLNTTKSDWGAVYNPITNSIVFVSDSMRNTKKNFFQKTFNETLYGWTDNYFQKIYTQSTNKDDLFNNRIHEIDPNINSFDYHTGPVVFSQNYDSIYFTVTHPGVDPVAKEKVGNKGKLSTILSTNRLEIYLSTLNKSGQWNKPEPFPYNNAASYSVGHAALSIDGKVLYFTSDMPGGIGGLDIWYCERLITGNWGLPKNCGNQINTKDDEAFPVIAPNGNLYFASKGHIGMGGYDLFVTAGEKNKWTKPLNMGSPINSPGDDFYYYAKDDTSGFFASNRKGGMGSDDIYQFVTTAPITIFHPSGKLILETKVIDNATKQPIYDAALEFQNTSSDVQWKQKSDGDGKDWHEVDANNPYAITVSKQGYYSSIVAINTKDSYTDTFKIVIPLDNKGGAKPTPKVYKLTDQITSLHEGDKFRLNNIHYDFDKDNIRPDAALILDTLVDILKQYPSMVIELSSHTDSRGSDQYNYNLADRRARSAVAYLITRGIDRKRLIARGYGEMMLLNRCSNGVVCSEEEHQENRRTEVRIIKL